LVPSTTACAHPLKPGCLHEAILPSGVFVRRVGIQLISQRRNPRVRMKAEARPLWHLAVDVIQKDKRLKVMSEVTGADQPSDKAMLLTGGAKNDLARAAHKL
jgi:hypothetical protein